MIENDIYNQQIVAFAANALHIGKLLRADVATRAVSRLCGSELDIELCFDGDKVSDFAYRVEACILGQAAAAIVATKIIGSTKQELRTMIDSLRAMLLDPEPAPEPAPSTRFAQLKILAPASAYKMRHGSILLIANALETCLNKVADD